MLSRPGEILQLEEDSAPLTPICQRSRMLEGRQSSTQRHSLITEETQHPLTLNTKHKITCLIVMNNYLHLYGTSTKLILNDVTQK